MLVPPSKNLLFDAGIEHLFPVPIVHSHHIASAPRLLYDGHVPAVVEQSADRDQRDDQKESGHHRFECRVTPVVKPTIRVQMSHDIPLGSGLTAMYT